MRKRIAALCLVAPSIAPACELTWADSKLSVPPLVRSFIAQECEAARGMSEETVDECVRAESYGYRAVVTLLTDSVVGERAAARYRVCTGGLGTVGGRFHRNKAECIGLPMGLQWRFEYTEEVNLHPAGLKPHTRFAALSRHLE